MIKTYVILICWLSLAAVYGLPTESNSTAAISELKTAGSSPQAYYTSPSSLSEFWRSGIGQILMIAAVFVSGIAILGGSAYLLAPVFGYRSCSVFGTCGKSDIANSPGGNLQDPSVHANAFGDMQNYGYSYPSSMIGYRKRSIEYLKPILSTLKTLYDKYEKDQQKQ